MSLSTAKNNAEIQTISFDSNTYPYGICVKKVKYHKDEPASSKVYRTSFYRMIWVCSGEVEVDLDIHKATLTTDDCFFIGKNQVFKINKYASFEAYIVDFTEGFYARTQLDIELLHESSLFNSKYGAVSFRLENPYKEMLVRFISFFFNINYKDFSQLLYQLAHNTVERMLLFAEWNIQRNQSRERLQSNNREYDMVKKFENLVAVNFANERNLGFYADQLSTSTRNLANACATLNKPTPKKIIVSYILDEAKRLLKFTDLSIKEIGYRLGYDEPNSFIKLFTTNEALSPASFRSKYTN